MLGFSHVKALGGLLAVALVAGLIGTGPGAHAQPPAKKKAGPKAGAKDSGPAKIATLPKGSLPAGAKLDAAALAKHIDKQVETKLNAEKVAISPRTTDAEFLRRVYLDLTGKIPTADQAKAFLASTAPDRRARLIDELLASKEFGAHQSDRWLELMLPKSSDNVRLSQFYGNLGRWLTTSFNENKPWDKMVREIVTATGTVDKESPAIYFMANLSVDKITDNVTKVFMGVQLQCAQCHNHPFTDYKQTQYWEMAAFFTKVRVQGNVKQVGKKADPKSVGVSEGAFVVKNKKTIPEGAKFLPPRFFQGEAPKLKGGEPYRPVLADWLTKPDNPFVSRALVNRVWGNLFGRGIVNPIDDMHEGNAPSHPELIADVAQQFTANGFDLKFLYRAICNSEAYQRSSKPAGNNIDAPNEMFSRMIIKSLTPQQLFDSMTTVLGNVGGGKGAGRLPIMAGRPGPQNARTAFVNFFNLDEGADPTEYNAGIPQVLRLMNSPQFNNTTALGRILGSAREPRQVLDALYLATLSRTPTDEEVTRMGAHLRKYRDEPRRAHADILWVLLNSSEFQLNR